MTAPSRYFNRELSLLDFQERVLALAENPNMPLLERVKFIAIVSSNLDEFFQVRVAGLMEQRSAGIRKVAADGRTPGQQLDEIAEKTQRLVARKERVFVNEIVPALEAQGIRLTSYPDLESSDREWLDELFETEMYPVLTPLAVDPAHPFPYISNLSMNLAVLVTNPKTGEQQFARVKVPQSLPRFIVLADQEHFVPVEQVISAHIDRLFPGMDVAGHHAFQVTRSAEQALEEEEADDLLEAMESLLVTRHRFSRAIRLEVGADMPEDLRDYLVSKLDIDPGALYVSEAPLALNGLWGIYGLDRPELKDEPWTPVTQPALADLEDESIFSAIRKGDLLIHLPYDSFITSVQAFIAEAAADPSVVAIKQTLYRTSNPDDPALGGETSIVRSMMAAARAGKQVVCLIELKARFDEEANINWARMLEEAGVHVVYGVAGLKTHSKIALVVRREPDGLRRYSHVGTGNYNPKTATLYEDLGILTSDEEIGADLSELFNVLTGFSRQKKYRRLLVAPTSMRRKLVRRIRKQAALGAEGRIIFKLNHLVDPKIIEELYEASSAGAYIDLVVRGVCCLRPGVPGMSDRITVRSIVGKYLEHSRIFRFGNGEDVEYLIGSADMMQRNLNSRVEALTPIIDKDLQARLEEVLRVDLNDDLLSWTLDIEGGWTKVQPVEGINAHYRFEELALARSKGAPPDPDAAGTTETTVMAAGGVIYRPGDDGQREVLIVHRPRYDDWSLPKGKLEAGETESEAALREVFEETGLDCTLGPELDSIEYVDHEGLHKVVRYWAMTVREGTFRSNEEVDEAHWRPVPEAAADLSYDRDRALVRSLEEALSR